MLRNAFGLTAIFAALGSTSHAMPPLESQPTAIRIGRVESGLLPPVSLVGSPSHAMPLEERMRHYRVPAVSIAVIDEGRIHWARAYGEAAPGTPATVSTLFQAASISKPVFAAGALQLVHRGHLQLDRPVNDALRSWRIPDSKAGQGDAVTLRRLLSHSAGLSVHGFRGYAAGEQVPTLRQLLDGAAPANSEPVRITTAPGTQWRYSGGGTSIAQQLVEDVTGRPLAEQMRGSILRAASMKDSGFDQPLAPARSKLAAVGRDSEGRPIAGGWHIYPEQAAAGLWTTPTDLARFALWVIKGARGPHAVAEQTFVAGRLLEPQPGLDPGGGERMGLGLFLGGEGRSLHFSHGGSNEGFRAFLLAFPETGQGVAVMVNGDGGRPLIQEIVRAVAREYAWPHSFHETVAPVRLTRAQLAPYIGAWRWGEGDADRAVLSEADGGLLAEPSGGEPIRFVALDSRNFIDPATGMKLRLESGGLVVVFPDKFEITAKRDTDGRRRR